MAIRFVSLLVVLCTAASLALAQSTCDEYRASYRDWDSGWKSSAAAACSALNGRTEDLGGGNSLTVTSASLDQFGNCALGLRRQYPAPTPAETSNTSVALEERQTSGPCVGQCQSQQGEEKTVNWTVGYTRSASIDADPNWRLIGEPNKIPSNGLMCDPVQPCQLQYQGPGADGWQSLAPTANGLYRLSLDVTVSYTGETCTPGPQDTNGLSKDAPIPDCPGFVGEVNGVPGCYGTATNPTRNDKEDKKPPLVKPGNPSAGEKPSSGPGSGTGGESRTPSTGNGGPAGGPAAAAGSNPGTDEGDGTTDKPEDGKEQQECGAPGQPKCRIDETGTPDGKSVFDAARDKLENEGQKMTDELEKIRSTQDKDTSWGTTPTWIQHAACTPWELGTLQIMGRSISLNINMCPIMPWVVGVMNFIWAVGTFFAIISMVFRVTTATAG